MLLEQHIMHECGRRMLTETRMLTAKTGKYQTTPVCTTVNPPCWTFMTFPLIIILNKAQAQVWRFDILIRHVTHEEPWPLSVQVGGLSPRFCMLGHHLLPTSFPLKKNSPSPLLILRLFPLWGFSCALALSPNKALPETPVWSLVNFYHSKSPRAQLNIKWMVSSSTNVKTKKKTDHK